MPNNDRYDIMTEVVIVSESPSVHGQVTVLRSQQVAMQHV